MSHVFEAKADIVLGSASPRRSDLLSSLGIKFSVEPSRADEPDPVAGEKPGAYAIRAAHAKAAEVAARFPDSFVIGSDTVVAVEDTILGKPKDREDAFRMLKMLSGRSHDVISGCAIFAPGGKVIEFAVDTRVTFIEAEDAALRAYAATGEPDDKAGSYAIQGIGGFLVREICGSYSNVVGMPLAEVLDVLRSQGAVVPKAL